MSTTKPPIARIDEHEMRRRFNDGKYWERLVAGEFTSRTAEKHAPYPASGQPFCTTSQEVFYIDSSGSEVARVHQYLLPDKKSLGGSGKPDPKRLLEDGKLFRLHKASAKQIDSDPPPIRPRGRLWVVLRRLLRLS